MLQPELSMNDTAPIIQPDEKYVKAVSVFATRSLSLDTNNNFPNHLPLFKSANGYGNVFQAVRMIN